MSQPSKPIRVVIGKVGVDIHDRGALALMIAFRDAGMEVIYTGRYQTAEAVVKIAIEEDADVIALTDHTGGMRYIADSVVKALKKYEGSNISIIAGGLIDPKDVRHLEKIGVTGNYGPGTPLNVIIDHVFTTVTKKQGNGRSLNRKSQS